MKGDKLWFGDTEASVVQSDPIRNQIVVKLPNGDVLLAEPRELMVKQPIPEKKKRRNSKAVNLTGHSKENPVPAQLQSSSQFTPDQPLQSSKSTNTASELEFTTFVLENGLVLRVGSVYFIESFTVPFVISRIHYCNVQNVLLVSCFRCTFNSDKTKVIGFSKDFVCTISSSYFTRQPNRGKFSFSFGKDLNSLISSAHARLISCQLDNLGVVSYSRDLRRHAVGAQMRQAVFSGTSLSATKPSQAISLGPFEPLHDHVLFGLSEANNFKVNFDHSHFYLLDSVMGAQWDVKQIKPDAPGFFFKFITSVTVYLDRKTFYLKFNFCYQGSRGVLKSLKKSYF